MRGREEGIILVNVLVALALGAALVTLMLTSQDAGIDRARRAAALAQAEAIALGAEASVAVALRRDMIEAPGTDHLGEAWASVAQEDVALGTGRFSVTLRDMQGALDLNGLADGGSVGQQALLRLVAVLGLPPEVAAEVLGVLAQRGRLTSLDDVPGLAPEVRDRLAPHVAFLTGIGGVNLNAAGPEVMAAMTGSGTATVRLIAARERAGFLTRGDLTDAGVVAVAGAGSHLGHLGGGDRRGGGRRAACADEPVRPGARAGPDGRRGRVAAVRTRGGDGAAGAAGRGVGIERGVADEKRRAPGGARRFWGRGPVARTGPAGSDLERFLSRKGREGPVFEQQGRVVGILTERIDEERAQRADACRLIAVSLTPGEAEARDGGKNECLVHSLSPLFLALAAGTGERRVQVGERILRFHGAGRRAVGDRGETDGCIFRDAVAEVDVGIEASSPRGRS